MRHSVTGPAFVCIVLAAAVLLPEAGMAQIVWEKSAANPALDLGAEGEWDDRHVSSPSVVFDGDE